MVNGLGYAPWHEHPGDLQWLERRRLQAADLFTQGKARAEVAGELCVSAQTASRWYGRWRDGGTARLRTARQGKPAQLGPTELAKIRRVLDDLLPATWHRTDQYGNTRIECDHGRLKARLRPMRGLKRDRSATVVVAGHAWCRTFGATTTSSRSRSQEAFELPPRSMSWPWRFDPSASNCFGIPPVDQMQQSPSGPQAAPAASVPGRHVRTQSVPFPDVLPNIRMTGSSRNRGGARQHPIIP